MTSIHGLLAEITRRLDAIDDRLDRVEVNASNAEQSTLVLEHRIGLLELRVRELVDARRGTPPDLDALEELLVATASPGELAAPLDLPAGAPLPLIERRAPFISPALLELTSDPDADPSDPPSSASGSTTSPAIDPTPAGAGAGGGKADAAPAGAQGGPARATTCSCEGRRRTDPCPCPHCHGTGDVVTLEEGEHGQQPQRDIPLGARVELAVTLGPRIGRLLGWTDAGDALVDLGGGVIDVPPQIIVGVCPGAGR